ncbi:MAG: PorT family protein [Bacteroidales bacterium]|nr:PorT family protein [Bacteroidales bacterium]
MKKRLLFFIAFSFILTFGAMAQFKLGANLGVPFSMRNFNVQDVEIQSSRPFNLGLITEIFVPLTGMGVEISALYELERINGGEIQNAVNAGFLVLPVNFKWKIGIPKFKFFLKGGPSFSILMHNSGFLKVYTDEKNTENYKMKPFNWGLNFGLGLELFDKAQVGVSYFYNFSDNINLVSSLSNEEKINGSNPGGFIVTLTYFFIH